MEQNEIFEKVRDCLVEVLDVEPDDVSGGSKLTEDLDAESIDFVDISFKLEQEFGIKIDQGELFPENLMSDDSLVQDGKLTDKAMEILRERMPHVDFSKLESDRRVDQLSEVFTVESLVDFIERKVSA